MEKEGIIKFAFKNIYPIDLIPIEYYHGLNQWRNLLYKEGLIGHDSIEDVGYGNLSVKLNNNYNFLITGSQTGKVGNLMGKHYTEVTEFNLKKQWLSYKGPIKASSESLTHGGIYLANSNIECVFHVHHHKLWKYLLKNNFSKTPLDSTYGTIKMAEEVKKLIHSAEGIIAMSGHRNGIISYGNSLDQAGNILLNLLKKL